MVIPYTPKLGEPTETQRNTARSFTVFATIIGKSTIYCAVLELLYCVHDPSKLTHRVLCWWAWKSIEDSESIADR